MQATDDLTLLRQYATGNSEEAFEALVSRHVRLVYSAALRQLRDPHLAEEVMAAGRYAVRLDGGLGNRHGGRVDCGWHALDVGR